MNKKFTILAVIFTVLAATVLTSGFSGAENGVPSPVLRTRDIAVSLNDDAFILQNEPRVTTREVSPGESLEITTREIEAGQVRHWLRTNGEGVTVAVIDTGIDVSHPDLLASADGSRKIIDWQDFSGEGLVDTSYHTSAVSGTIRTVFGDITIGRITSRSGVFHYGVLAETQLDNYSPIGQDLDQNKTARDEFFVLVADPVVGGRFDTVYIDTNGNKDLTDEIPVRVFRETGDFGRFGDNGSSFVIASVAENGHSVTVGFDGNGHGTHVAGIVGGYGAIHGIAPGAKLMSLKALGSSGDGSWGDIARAMVYAAENGADVISISVGTLAADTNGMSPQAQVMDELARRYNVTFVVAAGNSGPGLTSGASPNARSAITVGAYISPEIWNHNYGYTVEKEGLWYFSAVGPGKDGSLIPTVIAPGSACSTMPEWSGDGYGLMEGTSMACPHVTGGVALLISAARERNIEYTPETIKRALEMGAKTIDGYSPVEQGFGVVNIWQAWGHLRNLGAAPLVDISTYSYDFGEGMGVYAREFLPARLPYLLTNLAHDGRTLVLDVTSTADWMRPDRKHLILEPMQQRQINIEYNLPDKPGLYSGFVAGDDPDTYGTDLILPATVVKPYTFGNGRYRLRESDTLSGAQYRRFFLRIPEGTAELNLKLTVPVDEHGNPRGRVRMHIVQPDGAELALTGYAGLGGMKNTVSFPISKPQAGTWEVIVYSAASLSYFNRLHSEYTLEASVRGVYLEEGRRQAVLPEGSSGIINQSLTFRNAYGSRSLRIRGVGLAPVYDEKEPQYFTVKHQRTTAGPVIEVPAGALELRVAITDPEDREADIDLYLYRYDEEASDFKEAATSITIGSSDEEIVLTNPQPGRYMAYIDGYYIPEGSIGIEYRERVIVDAGDVTSAPELLRVANNEEFTIDAAVTVPRENGEFFGYFIIEDAGSGEVLAMYPVLFSVGQPGITLYLDDRPLTRDERNFVTIFARDGETMQPVTSNIEINGKLYHLQGGRLTIPVIPNQESTMIKILLQDWFFAPLETEYQLETGQPGEKWLPGKQEFPYSARKVQYLATLD